MEVRCGNNSLESVVSVPTEARRVRYIHTTHNSWHHLHYIIFKLYYISTILAKSIWHTVLKWFKNNNRHRDTRTDFIPYKVSYRTTTDSVILLTNRDTDFEYDKLKMQWLVKYGKTIATQLFWQLDSQYKTCQFNRHCLFILLFL